MSIFKKSEHNTTESSAPPDLLAVVFYRTVHLNLENRERSKLRNNTGIEKINKTRK